MIDVSEARYEISEGDWYAIEWLENRSFTGKLVKQYVSRTVFELEKDGEAFEFEMPQANREESVATYMQMYWRLFEIKKLLRTKSEEEEA